MNMNFRKVQFLTLLLAAGSLIASDTRLIEAAKGGDAKTVRDLLSQHVPATTAEADGTTALHYAVRNDNLDIADLLIANGAPVNAATRYNITPLSLACDHGNAAMIERLLKAGADPDGTSEEGQAALMSASLAGKVNAIKVLLTHGAKVNVAEPVKGQTALMWAASEGHTSAVETLIEFGADVKAKSKSGFTPLLFAVRNGEKETVEALLAHGANANDKAPDGTSALNVAVVNAAYDVGAVLLDHGADPNAPDARGSALHAIAWLRKPGSDGGDGLGKRSYGPPLQKGNMSGMELARRLLEHGANPNARVHFQERLNLASRDATARNPPLIHLGRHILTYSGATPFYIAAHNGDYQYMQLLADHGADPKAVNELNISPLIIASGLDYWEGETPGPYTGVPEAERLEAVKLAIKLGNDINYAAIFGDFKMEGDPHYLLLFYPLNMKEIGEKVV